MNCINLYFELITFTLHLSCTMPIYRYFKKIHFPCFISSRLFVAFELYCFFEIYMTPIYFICFIPFSFNMLNYLYMESFPLLWLGFFLEKIIILNILRHPFSNFILHYISFSYSQLDVDLYFKQYHAPSGLFQFFFVVLILTVFLVSKTKFLLFHIYLHFFFKTPISYLSFFSPFWKLFQLNLY